MTQRLILTLIAIALTIQAQAGTIKGVITDANSNEPLIGASVLIEGTSNGAATDLDGNYTIYNVTPGTYTLIVSYVSYNQINHSDVIVEADNETVINFEMSSNDINLQELEVVARVNRESENILLLEQKHALVASQSVGARELSRKGIGDAQAAVAQISGVSRQEGVKNVFVRGLGDRYNATLLNGFPIPSEDPEYKNIALEFFSTDVIQNIDVHKAFSGRNSSDVGAAIININSKRLIGNQSFSAELSGGANTEALGNDFIMAEGANYFVFTNNNHPTSGSYDFPNSLDPSSVKLPMNLSFVLSGGKQYDIGANRNPLSFFLVASHSTDYSYTRELVRSITTGEEEPYQDQIGAKYSHNTNQLALANLNYNINRKHNIAYNFMMLHAMNAYVGEYSGRDAEKNQDPPYEVFLRRQQFNDNLLIANQIISDWELSQKMKFNLGVSYNHIKGLEPDRRENFLYQSLDGSYALMGSNRQKRFFSELKENDINVKTNLVYKLNDSFGDDNSSLVLGYDGRFVDDKFESIEYNYDPYNPIAFNLEDLKLDDVYNQENYNLGHFRMINGEPNTYHVTKYINSAYVEGTYQLSPKFNINGGFRADYVDMNINYAVDHTSPGEKSLDKKLYYLPSSNLRYDINEKNVLRLGLSITYTLPQSKEISPYRYVNIGFASQGNADLKPSDNYNADLKWDYYLSPSELISLTGFYKHVANPIARVEAGNSAGVLMYDNISEFANVAGVELEARKNISNNYNSVTGKSTRLSFGLNASYIYTTMEVDYIDNTTRNSQLEGAAPLIANFDISFNHMNNNKSILASIVFNYFSERIHTIGMLGFRDIVEEGVGTLDFVSSYKLNKNFTLKLKASNLLNPSYRLTRERSSSKEQVILNEFKKGMNISLGLNYKL